MVTLSDIPGPLNGLMEMLTSYQSGIKPNVTYSYAYADPGACRASTTMPGPC